MEEEVLGKKDLEEIFTGFEKRQDEKLKGLEDRIDQKITGLEVRMDQKMTGLEVRVIDQFHIISERLMDQIKLLAEGHDGVIDRLNGIDKRFDHMEKENERQHLETRALVKLSFSELDRRLTDLESQMKQMQEWRKQVDSRFAI
jgi:uncharacterized coiled-coil protein SlyX